MKSSYSIAVISLLLLTQTAACVHAFMEVKPREIEPEEPPVHVPSPVKAHLSDGRIALFGTGASFTADSIMGTGRIYGPDLREDSLGTSIDALPLDLIAALETYDERLRPMETLVASSLATAGAFMATGVALVAIFGSCPTIYTDDGSGPRLEAEAFPNSIVPLFEIRDVDLLHIRDNSDDTLRVEVRNEALETHYINHMELVEVIHPADTWVVPDNEGRPWLLGDLMLPERAVDLGGRDVLPDLRAADDLQYASSPHALAATSQPDVTDYIDLHLPSPPSDSAALYLRLRNSLLGTVFFYDFMLDSQGAHALNWMRDELNSIAGAVKLGGFYQEHMGLRVEIWDDGAFRQVGRVREVGPIAFDHVVVPFRVPGGDSLHLRLRFITDAWRIDHAAVGALHGPALSHRVPPAAVHSPNLPQDIHSALGRPDENYAITQPGDRFWVDFPLSELRADSLRTVMVASQGFYTEWIRRQWVQDDVAGQPFEPTATSLRDALQKWLSVKDEFEERFETTKIPVR